MQTKSKNVDINNIDEQILKVYADMLKNDKTVIFPTETVYGLGANALSETAVTKIYEAKGRPSDNPLIVHIAKKEHINKYVKKLNENAKKVIDAFWPGPITLVLEKKDIIPSKTSGGLNTVAIRMPSNKIANKLIDLAGVPIAAPSANISGRPSPTHAQHVYNEMNGRVDGIILSEDCTFGLESTVLDLTESTPMILRPGSITKEMLEEVVGEIKIDKSIESKDQNIKAKAPGMKYTHYSPNAEVYIVNGDGELLFSKINSLIEKDFESGMKIGVLCRAQNKSQYLKSKAEIICLGENLQEVAKNLFSSLIKCDELGLDIVYAEAFSSENEGFAIMNRLKKSAGYKIIEA